LGYPVGLALPNDSGVLVKFNCANLQNIPKVQYLSEAFGSAKPTSAGRVVSTKCLNLVKITFTDRDGYDILRIYTQKGENMTATISSWGNSLGLKFPKNILEPIKPQKEKYDINELVKLIPPDYKSHEVIDNKVGAEEW